MSWNRLADSSMRSSRASTEGRAFAGWVALVRDLRPSHLRHHSGDIPSPSGQGSEQTRVPAWGEGILRQRHGEQEQVGDSARCGTWGTCERQTVLRALASACYQTHRLRSRGEDRSEKNKGGKPHGGSDSCRLVRSSRLMRLVSQGLSSALKGRVSIARGR